jgi:nucleoside-diphosphate-sugar epimerase
MHRSPVLEEDFRQILATSLPWEKLAGRTLLVTGATGFIAAYLIEALLFWNDQKSQAPVRILALARNAEKARARFASYLDRTDFKLLLQDVSEPIILSETVHYLIHAASQARPQYFESDPVGTLKPNILGTYHLLEWARQSSLLQFLFVSSGEVYGKFDPPPDQPLEENRYGTVDPRASRSSYAEGKRAGEALAQAWHHQYGVPVATARLGHTYGPGLDLNDGRVFADFVANIVRGENIALKSDGSVMRPFCYLSDAVTGLLAILLQAPAGEVYNLVNDEAEMKIADLAELLCGLFPEKKLRVTYPSLSPGQKPAAQWNPGVRVGSKKLRTLGWRPLVSPAEGFRRTILSYNPEGCLPASSP